MQFQYDSKTSNDNQERHGIDFATAEQLWNDPALREIPLTTDDEARWLVVGRLDSQVWAALIGRDGDAIRLLAVRRARPEEAALYES